MGQLNEKEDPDKILSEINTFEESLKEENKTSTKTFNYAKNIIKEFQTYKLILDKIPKKKFGLSPLRKKIENNDNNNTNNENYDKNKIEEINHKFERVNKWIKMAKTPYYNNFHYIFQKIKRGSKEKDLVKRKKKLSYMGSSKNIKNGLKEKDIKNYRPRKQTDAEEFLNNDNTDLVIVTKKYKKTNSFDNSSLISNHENNNQKKNTGSRVNSFLDNYTDKKIEEKIVLFYLNNKSKFQERVFKGPPDSFRWISWCIVNEVPLDRDINIYNYYLTIDLENENKERIIRDIERTFSDQNISKDELRKKETSLYNVLKAFWNLDKEVGYCQGMNLMVGFLLLVSEGNELDCFYLLISNFSTTFKERKKNDFSFRGLYSEEFPLLYFLNFIFDNLLAENEPEIKNHLDEMGITYDLWIGQWFQTLFTIVLPINWCKRLWDCIYTDNIYFIVKFGIAFTRLIKNEIMEKNEEIDIIEFFKELKKYSLCPENKFLEQKIDINLLILKANKIKLDPEEYIKLFKKNGDNFDEFNKKMEKNNKISYLLEYGNHMVSDYKAKHRNTILFRSTIKEENIEEDKVININQIQGEVPSIKKDKKENEKKIIKNEKKNVKNEEQNSNQYYDPKDKKIKININKSIMENVKIFESKNDDNNQVKMNKINFKESSIEKKKNNSNYTNNNKKTSPNFNTDQKSNYTNTPYKHDQVKIPKIEISACVNTAKKETDDLSRYNKFLNKNYFPQTENQNKQQNFYKNLNSQENQKNINNINQNNLYQNYFENIYNQQNQQITNSPFKNQYYLNQVIPTNVKNNNLVGNDNINNKNMSNNNLKLKVIHIDNTIKYNNINNNNIYNNINNNLNNNYNYFNIINNNINMTNFNNFNLNNNINSNIESNSNINYKVNKNYNNSNFNNNINNIYYDNLGYKVNYTMNINANNNYNYNNINYINNNITKENKEEINNNITNNNLNNYDIYNNINNNDINNNQFQDSQTNVYYNYAPNQNQQKMCKVIKLYDANQQNNIDIKK